MRARLALAILIGATLPALAGGGFDIVIPGRPGVPIIINGIDASYAVVEGEWGLGKGEQVQPTVYGGRSVSDLSADVDSFIIRAPAICRATTSEIKATAKRKAATAPRKLSVSIMVVAIHRSRCEQKLPFYPPPIIIAPAGQRRRHAPERRRQHAQNGDTGMPETSSAARRTKIFISAGNFHGKKPTPTKTCSQERSINASDDFRIGSGHRRGDRQRRAPAIAWPPRRFLPPLRTGLYQPSADIGCNTGCGGWAHERLPDPV